MAALDIYSTLVVLLLGMILTGFATPTSKALILDECKNHYNPQCGREIDGFIFGNGIVTDSCCEDLMSLGKPCHELFISQTQATLHPNITLASVASKSTRVWNKCFAITRSQIAETKTVEGCELKFNPQCGQEIANFIFNNGNNVTQSCCRELQLLGRDCHNLIFNRAFTKNYPSFKRAQGVARSTQVWNKCRDDLVSTKSSTSSLKN